jgi:hypothetical protein
MSATAAARTEVRTQIGDNAEEVCWETLLLHLTGKNNELGWEALAALSEKEHCNVLLFTQVHSTTMYKANCTKAIDNWQQARQAGVAQAAAERMGRDKTGGRWVDVAYKTSHQLIPRRMNESWPFRIIFYRSQITHTYSKNRTTGLDEPTTNGGFGHYESIVAWTPSSPGNPDYPMADYEGVFEPNTRLHEHLKHIGTRLMAGQYNDLSRVRMMRDDMARRDVPDWRTMNGVGLRRAGLNSEKNNKLGYRGLDCLPCIIIATKTRPVDMTGSDIGSAVQLPQVMSYKLMCEYGILEGTLTASQLVLISLHSFPQLVQLYEGLTARQLQAPTSSDYEPIDELQYPRLNADEAFKREAAKIRPAAVHNSRRREVAERPAAVAADTALATARVDKRSAPSLSTLSNQPILLPPAPSNAPKAIEIVKCSRDGQRFKVLWGPPTHDWTWESKEAMMKWEEYREVMLAFAMKEGIDLYADEQPPEADE